MPDGSNNYHPGFLSKSRGEPCNSPRLLLCAKRWLRWLWAGLRDLKINPKCATRRDLMALLAPKLSPHIKSRKAKQAETDEKQGCGFRHRQVADVGTVRIGRRVEVYTPDGA